MNESDGCKFTGIEKNYSIEDLAQKTIGTLSGGQQQKVMIAHNLAKEPEVLLLAEPFSNLDFSAREFLQGVLQNLREERNADCHGLSGFRRAS